VELEGRSVLEAVRLPRELEAVPREIQPGIPQELDEAHVRCPVRARRIVKDLVYHGREPELAARGACLSCGRGPVALLAGLLRAIAARSRAPRRVEGAHRAARQARGAHEPEVGARLSAEERAVAGLPRLQLVAVARRLAPRKIELAGRARGARRIVIPR